MFAVLETASSKVLFLLNHQPIIDESGLHGQVRACDISPKTHHFVEVSSEPTPFIGSGYTLIDDVWGVFDQSVIDDMIARIKKESVPSTISMSQLRRVLLAHDLLTQTQTIIDAAGNESLNIMWNFENIVKRTSSDVNNIGTALGLSELAMDDMFIEAQLL